MAIPFFPADERLVHFDDTHQLLEIGIVHSGAKPVAHVESTLEGASPDHAMNLQGTDTYLRSEHEVKHFEPCAQRQLRLLENGSRLEREAVGRTIVFTAF